MPLPTTPPNGGLPKLPPLDNTSSLPPAPTRRTPPAQPARPAAAKPKQARPRPAPEPEPEPHDDGWRVDPRTGKKYKELPKTEWKEDGFSVCNVEEDLENAFDGKDLNKAADLFLAHLRVPPSPEELQRMREAKARAKKRQDEEYALQQKQFDAQDQQRVEREEERKAARKKK